MNHFSFIDRNSRAFALTLHTTRVRGTARSVNSIVKSQHRCALTLGSEIADLAFTIHNSTNVNGERRKRGKERRREEGSLSGHKPFIYMFYLMFVCRLSWDSFITTPRTAAFSSAN